MALAKNPPNTIHLGGEITKLNENIAGVAITPGMQIEFYNDSGKMKWRPVASATNVAAPIFALEKIIHNKTVDDTYAIGELVYAAMFHKGATVWGIVGSGENIAASDYLQPAGNGKLKEATAVTEDAGVARLQAIEAVGIVSADTRLKVQVL